MEKLREHMHTGESSAVTNTINSRCSAQVSAFSSFHLKATEQVIRIFSFLDTHIELGTCRFPPHQTMEHTDLKELQLGTLSKIQLCYTSKPSVIWNLISKIF